MRRHLSASLAALVLTVGGAGFAPQCAGGGGGTTGSNCMYGAPSSTTASVKCNVSGKYRIRATCIASYGNLYHKFGEYRTNSAWSTVRCTTATKPDDFVHSYTVVFG